MRFALAHKVATYLVVGCAFLAMAMGGGVDGPVALGGTLALIVSWWWEPPRVRYERWTWLWTTFSLLALVYAILAAIVTGDILGVGGQFLIALTVAKAFSRRTARDWQQLYLLSFLMLVAGSVLNPDITYGLCFLGFVIAITWALTLFHLRREMEDNLLVKHAADRASERVEVRRILDSKRIVGARFFAGTGALSFCVFLGAAVLFLALPRVGFGFFLKTRGGLTFTGFSDGVRLGGHGLIKNDDTIVMRVEIDAKRGGRDAPEIHWRGAAFDHYEGGRWTRAREAPRTLDWRDMPRSGTERHTITWMGESWEQPDELERDLVRQDVWLEPFETDVLFGASMPHVFELASVVRPRAPKDPRNDDLRVDHPSTIHYAVWSRLDTPPPAVLRVAHGAMPRGYEKYLQLPDEITARTYELAAAITAGQPTQYDKALAIERWLDQNLSYTLELAEPGRQEPIDFFLFDRKQGHCEYFASAFAILARAAHIPTRQVNGFLGGEWNEYQGYVAVRAGDAHSWDEVYFPGSGWVTFDPTPPNRHDPLGRGGDGIGARLSRLVDTLRFQWTKWVIEYDLVSQLSLFKDLGGVLRRTAGGVRDAIVDHWGTAGIAAAAIAAILALRRRRRAIAMAPTRATARPRARSPIGKLYDQTVRRIAKTGMVIEAAATPREVAERAAGRIAAAAPELHELVELYYAAEWGRRADAEAERRAEALASAIRRAIEALPR